MGPPAAASERWVRALQGLAAAAAGLLYPQRCPGCEALQQPGRESFCPSCAPSVERLDPASLAQRGCQACPRCGTLLPLAASPERCPGCCSQARPPYAGLQACAAWGGPLAAAVARMKYGRRPDLARGLLRALGDSVTEPAPSPDLLVPVPLHPSRLRERGYNQAALLARGLARRWAVPLDLDALVRTRATRAQQELGAGERHANVRGAFRALPAAVRGRRILLVDDVFTTGSTAAACSEALLAAGAARVSVWALARAAREER